jgi:hypothetical protein
MFYGIFDRRHLRLHAYDYIFYMEPDTRPVRAQWLETLYREAAVHHPFWMRGAVANLEGADPSPHINGNALYRYNDPGFHGYICDARGAYAREPNFARSLHVHREKRALAELFPMFSHASFLRSLGAQQVDLDAFLRDNPRTVLVHGRGMVAVLERKFPAPALPRVILSGGGSPNHNRQRRKDAGAAGAAGAAGSSAAGASSADAAGAVAQRRHADLCRAQV